MTKATRLKVTAIFLAIIIILILPALFIPINFLGKSIIFWAGMLSIIVGIISFAQKIILTKRPKWIFNTYQLFMVILGILLVNDGLNSAVHEINKFANSIIAIIYILIFLIVIVMYRKHINPGDVDVSHLLYNNDKKRDKKHKNNRKQRCLYFWPQFPAMFKNEYQ